MGKRINRNTRVAGGTLGFSLVEVLVAIVVVGVGALAIGALFPSATRDIGTSERTTRAAEYLQEGVERLTSLQYNDPLLVPGMAHMDADNPLPGGYERSWTVREDYPISGCKTFVVEVAWQEGSDERNVEAVMSLASVGR
jgi:prepilin-type N-terminal cleavage/methylation domain-containing protein